MGSGGESIFCITLKNAKVILLLLVTKKSQCIVGNKVITVVEATDAGEVILLEIPVHCSHVTVICFSAK